MPPKTRMTSRPEALQAVARASHLLTVSDVFPAHVGNLPGSPGTPPSLWRLPIGRQPGAHPQPGMRILQGKPAAVGLGHQAAQIEPQPHTTGVA